MSNPTKILYQDLEADLQRIFDELKEIQGSFGSLVERFRNIDVHMLAEDEKKVIQDLIDAYTNDGRGLTRERITKLEAKVIELQENLSNLNISQESIEMGNTLESYEYDEEGNVVKHVATGDRNFTEVFNYKTDGSGELASSIKTFTQEDGSEVEIKKEYTYTDGNITSIKTTTTITPKATE